MRRICPPPFLCGLFALAGKALHVNRPFLKQVEHVRCGIGLFFGIDKVWLWFATHYCAKNPLRRARHYPALQKITQLFQRQKPSMAHDHVIKHVDLHQLAGSDEVTGHFDVSLGWFRLP